MGTRSNFSDSREGAPQWPMIHFWSNRVQAAVASTLEIQKKQATSLFEKEKEKEKNVHPLALFSPQMQMTILSPRSSMNA